MQLVGYLEGIQGLDESVWHAHTAVCRQLVMTLLLLLPTCGAKGSTAGACNVEWHRVHSLVRALSGR